MPTAAGCREHDGLPMPGQMRVAPGRSDSPEAPARGGDCWRRH